MTWEVIEHEVSRAMTYIKKFHGGYIRFYVGGLFDGGWYIAVRLYEAKGAYRWETKEKEFHVQKLLRDAVYEVFGRSSIEEIQSLIESIIALEGYTEEL